VKKFVPDSKEIPEGFENKEFKIRMLTVNDLVKDYDAVISSVDHLFGVFGPNYDWPRKDLTIEQNLIDLGWHQKEFEMKNSFAYTVMNFQESHCLGCVYIEPSEKKKYDAKIICWVRQSEIENGLDEKLFFAIKLWIKEEWWFESVAFPGRDLSWEEWGNLPNK